MKIQKILSQHRRDFKAVYECESCGAIKEGNGYDDDYFHSDVIPSMVCESCSATAGPDYRPLKPKYSAITVI